jgi:flagellar export protein FliJ
MSTYPLQQIADIKKRRLEEAEKILQQKREALEQENAKLVSLEEEFQKSRTHYEEKINQLRDELDSGTTSDKVEQMKNYLKIVEDDMKIKKKKVVEQQGAVKTAEEAVEQARMDMLKKQQDVEKLDIHKKQWTKEARKEIQKKEASDQDEIGSAGYVRKKRGGR